MPGAVAVSGREAAALASTTSRTVESPASGAAASAAALLPSAPSPTSGVYASPCAGASPATVVSADVVCRAAASAGVDSVKRRKSRGLDSLQTKQAPLRRAGTPFRIQVAS